MSITTIVLLLLSLALATALAVALAWVPMRLLLGQMAKNVLHFIERQRERRKVPRETPDRRRL